jgi:hypothetical protein
MGKNKEPDRFRPPPSEVLKKFTALCRKSLVLDGSTELHFTIRGTGISEGIFTDSREAWDSDNELSNSFESVDPCAPGLSFNFICCSSTATPNTDQIPG